MQLIDKNIRVYLQTAVFFFLFASFTHFDQFALDYGLRIAVRMTRVWFFSGLSSMAKCYNFTDVIINLLRILLMIDINMNKYIIKIVMQPMG